MASNLAIEEASFRDIQVASKVWLIMRCAFSYHIKKLKLNVFLLALFFEANNFVPFASQVSNGERLPLEVKELVSCDMYPQVSFAFSFKMNNVV